MAKLIYENWSDMVRFADGRRTRKSRQRLLRKWFGEFSTMGQNATRRELEICRRYNILPKYVCSHLERAEIFGVVYSTDLAAMAAENPARSTDLVLSHLRECWEKIQPHRGQKLYRPSWMASGEISQIQATIRAFPIALPDAVLKEMAQPDVFWPGNIEVYKDINSQRFASFLRSL
jgi:hypothetical protein